MKNRDILKLASRVFKTNFMRTALTVAGIGVGIGAILFLVSLGYGMQKVILDKIANSDALLAIDIVPGVSDELKLNNNLIEKLYKLESVSEISTLVSYDSLIETNDFSGNVSAEFVQDSYFNLSGINTLEGDFFNDEQLNNIVISTAALKLINLDNYNKISDLEKNNFRLTIIMPVSNSEANNNIEGEVRLTKLDRDFKVSGIIKDDVTPMVYLNSKNIDKLNISEFNQLKVRAKNDKYVETLKDEIYNMGYSFSSISETIDQANKIFSIIQIILAVFGVIALIVSAIGMFNTMTIELLQRTKEIGIMKALGAKNKDIKKLFLTEALMIGFFGGVSGIAIGYSFEYIFNLLLNFLAKSLGGEPIDIFYTPLWFLLTILAFSNFVGFLTGVWPSIRASKLNPLEALRYK